MQNIVLLLTACINPQGMPNTILCNPTVRLKQYLNAIDFYLKNTDVNIVVVENTNYDLSKHFPASNRLEMLSFDGNNYNKQLGKGYGESLIIEYAFKNSEFIRESVAVCKITGRNIIPDISKRISDYSPKKDNVIAQIDPKRRFVVAKCICCPYIFWVDYFLPYKEKIDDSKKYYFENLLFDAMINWISEKHGFSIVLRPIEIHGISGTSSQPIRMKKTDCIKSMVKSIVFLLRYKML